LEVIAGTGRPRVNFKFRSAVLSTFNVGLLRDISDVGDKKSWSISSESPSRQVLTPMPLVEIHPGDRWKPSGMDIAADHNVINFSFELFD